MDLSSAKSYMIDDKILLRSLIYIKKKRSPNMELWGTLTIIGNHVEDRPLGNTHRCPKMELWGKPKIIGKHVEDWPLSNTRGFLLLRKLSINFSRGPDIQIDLI